MNETTASLINRSSATATYDLENCYEHYIFVGPDGIPIPYYAANFLTVAFDPRDVSTNSRELARLYVAADPGNSGRFWVRRHAVQASDSGIVVGYTFRRNVRFPIPMSFNSSLYERYERLTISWDTGTLMKLWSGEAFADITAPLNGVLGSDITGMNARHKFFRWSFGNFILDKAMTSIPPDPSIIEPAGPYELVHSTDSFTFNYSEEPQAIAVTTGIRIDNFWLFGVGHWDSNAIDLLH